MKQSIIGYLTTCQFSMYIFVYLLENTIPPYRTIELLMFLLTTKLYYDSVVNILMVYIYISRTTYLNLINTIVHSIY